MTLRIHRPPGGVLFESASAPGEFRLAGEDFSFNGLFTASDPQAYAAGHFERARKAAAPPADAPLAPPLESQEVWAAGVTYYRSRTARMEEAESAGGDVFYDKVYEADRPELFFKATPARARGHLDRVGIRSDSTWDVPEPELTLAVSSRGRIFGYTGGNDMSSRSIEGENPLYLPQAKVYTGSCSLGPSLVVGDPPGPRDTIAVEIRRDGAAVFSGSTEVARIKRSFEELADYLFRCNEFPAGAYLMTGTGIVPGSDFTLSPGDEILVTVAGAGTLANTVEKV